MSLGSRLLRLMRAYAGQLGDLDPDELLERLRQSAPEPPPRARPAPPPPSNTRSASDPIAKAYARLELEPGAGVTEAKKAWRRLISRYHPDRFANEPAKQAKAAEVAAGLTEAYQTIRDHEATP
jgi:DnaJ-domain-containing protein 1